MAVETVLVVGADAPTRATLAQLLARRGCQAALAAGGGEALAALAQARVDLVLAEAAELPRLARAHQVGRDIPLVLLAHSAAGPEALEAMREGVFACLPMPPTAEGLAELLERVDLWQALLRAGEAPNPARPGRPEAPADLLVGRHPRLLNVVETVRRAAGSKATLLVQGESGTGKELLARLAHAASPRASGPMVKVNCAALAESLLESELFGHERGAFTGAIVERHGRFELAHRGTLLLDEISEIPPTLQAKLLRAIEEEEFERVGGTETLKVDVRIVATTNRDLAREVAEGRFRADLYYRLSVVPVIVPPLRERRDDIPLLAQHFLRRFRREADSPVRRISREAMDLLLRHPWPGNVRELRNLVHRAVVLGAREEIGPEDLPPEVAAAQPGTLAGALAVGRSIDDVERDLIHKPLASTGGNKTAAARILRVTPRTLRNKLDRYAGAGYAGAPGTA